jgi:hypothetical protein
MSNKNFDVKPGAENKGLIYKSNVPDVSDPAIAKQRLNDIEKAIRAHLERMADYENRGHIVGTDAGLSLVGPSNPDSNGVVARAHNASMAAIEEKLAELVARIAALEAKK